MTLLRIELQQLYRSWLFNGIPQLYPSLIFC